MLNKMSKLNSARLYFFICNYCIENIVEDLEIKNLTFSQIMQRFNAFKKLSKLKNAIENAIYKKKSLSELKNTCFISSKTNKNERIYFYSNVINIFIDKRGVVHIKIITPIGDDLEIQQFNDESNNLSYNKCLYAVASIMHLIDDDLHENMNILSFLDD